MDPTIDSALELLDKYGKIVLRVYPHSQGTKEFRQYINLHKQYEGYGDRIGVTTARKNAEGLWDVHSIGIVIDTTPEEHLNFIDREYGIQSILQWDLPYPSEEERVLPPSKMLWSMYNVGR